MRKKKIQAHVGGLIVCFYQAETGEVNRFRVGWILYYDRRFYQKVDNTAGGRSQERGGYPVSTMPLPVYF